MATKNFTQFSTTTLTTGDYIVGYKADSSAEIKTRVQDIVNVVSGTNLFLPKSIYQSASGNWESTYSTFSTSSAFSIVAGGNSRAANITIGTNDAYHLRFETNNNAKMTILSSGEVGIGTTITETASAGNGGLIVKNNLLVGGTTIKETTNLTLSSVVNGDFQNTTGLTAIGSTGWYQGLPFGWTSAVDPPVYTVWNGGGGDFVANPSQLATGAGSSSFRQNLGILPIMSNINVTFDYASTSIAAWSSGILNAAIYDGNFKVLATNTYTTAGTYSLAVTAVPADTTIIVGFWVSSVSPGLNNVSVTQVTNTALTVAGGVSASSIVTPRLQVQNGIVIFSNLPTLSANLPVGAVWNKDGALRIV